MELLDLGSVKIRLNWVSETVEICPHVVPPLSGAAFGTVVVCWRGKEGKLIRFRPTSA